LRRSIAVRLFGVPGPGRVRSWALMDATIVKKVEMKTRPTHERTRALLKVEVMCGLVAMIYKIAENRPRAARSPSSR